MAGLPSPASKAPVSKAPVSKAPVSKASVEVRPTVILIPLMAAFLAFPSLVLRYPGHAASELVFPIALTGLLVAVAIVGHELSHALIARLFGWPLTEVKFSLLGASVTIDVPNHLPPGPIALTAAAGPVFNACLAGLLHLVSALLPGLYGTALGSAATLSMVLAVTNILPVNPLDGFRLRESRVLPPRLVSVLLWALALGITAFAVTPQAAVLLAVIGPLTARFFNRRFLAEPAQTSSALPAAIPSELPG